jgi:hypothetical protein
MQGRTDWSKILPFLKKKDTAAPSIVDVRTTQVVNKPGTTQYIEVPEDDDEEEAVATPAKVSKPSARSASKQLRPKRKK